MTMATKVRLSEAEMAKRERKALDAIASARLEGVPLRVEYLQLLEAWTRGEITADQLLQNASK